MLKSWTWDIDPRTKGWATVSHFTVIYDACVLYPAPLRDFLLRLALRDLFRARWTEQILDEMQRAILNTRDDIPEERLQRMRGLMNAHVRDAVITGYQPLINGLDLPDPDDRHVLAAAIRGGAQIILTYNLKDFPKSKLETFGIEAQHPDDFLEHLFDLHPSILLDVAKEWRMSLRMPPQTPEDIISALERQSLPKFADLLSDYVSLI